MGSKIEIRNLHIHYDELNVIDNFSYIFEENKAYCIMGQSGTGKTSLINAIMGLTDYEGTITITGSHIAAVFQENRLLEHLTPYKNISLCMDNHYNKKDVYALLEKSGLAGFAHKKTATLSGGMKRRICILRAFLAPKDILILDEPFTGMDSVTRNTMLSLIKEYGKDCTILLISHNPEDATVLGADIIDLASIK